MLREVELYVKEIVEYNHKVTIKIDVDSEVADGEIESIINDLESEGISTLEDIEIQLEDKSINIIEVCEDTGETEEFEIYDYSY